jgi:hypothetical protein
MQYIDVRSDPATWVEKPAIKIAAIQTTDYYSAQKNTEMNEDL